MARISTYGQDSTLNKLDKVLGTDSATGGTKNYTINSIMGLINDEGLVQAFDGSTFKFQSYVAGSSDPQGVINLNAGAASTAAFSAINQIYISTKDATGLSLNEYLENADNDFIKISKKGNLNQFGIFEVTDIADHDGGAYKLLTLTPRGTNGNLVVNDDYFVSNYSALYDQDFSDNSVTEFGDVTDAGSGAIITSAERTSLNNFTANGLVHNDVVDNVTTTDTTVPLSANQGKILKGLIDSINTLLTSDNVDLDSLQEVVDYIEANRSTLDSLGISNIAGLQAALDSKQNTEVGKGLSTEDFTSALLTKLNGIAAQAEVNVQSNWNEANTGSDAFIQNKPSDLTNLTIHGVTELNDVTSAGSGDIITSSERTKLTGIAAGAEVNVQSNWNETDSNSDAFIQNKPTLAPSGAEANVQSDFNETDTGSDAFILNKPDLTLKADKATTIEVAGTANEVEVSPSGAQDLSASRTFTVGLPNNVTVTNDLTVGDTIELTNAQGSTPTFDNGFYHILEDTADTLHFRYGGKDVSIDYFTEILPTGILNGGELTKANNTQFTIAAGDGIINDLNKTAGSDPHPEIKKINWSQQTITVFNLDSNETGQLNAWIYVDVNGVVQQQATAFTDAQKRSNIVIGSAIHTEGVLKFVRTFPVTAYNSNSQLTEFANIFGPLKKSGHKVSANGTNLSIDRAAGVAFALGRNYAADPENPSTVSDSAQAQSTIHRYYRDGNNGFVLDDGVAGAGYTALDPAKYDDGTGTLATVSGGHYSVQRLYYFPGTPSIIISYYGHDEYNSLDAAEKNYIFEDFIENENTAQQAVYLGAVIMSGGATALNNSAQAKFLTAGSFRGLASVNLGGVAASATLGDLGDVTISAVANNQLLKYNSSSTNWENATVDSDDIVEGSTNLYYPSADATKVGHISVTQAVDLDTIESDTATNNAKVTFPGFGTTSGTSLEGNTQFVDGTGTTGILPKFSGSDTLTDSVIHEVFGNIGINTGFPNVSFEINASDAIKIPSGNQSSRPGIPANGMLRYSTTDNQFEGYANGAWGAIAGSGGGSGEIVKETFSGTGSQATFTLSNTIADIDNISVYVSGVYQYPSNYTVSGADVTFAAGSIPASGTDNVHVVHTTTVSSITEVGSVFVDQFTGNGTDTQFSPLGAAPSSENHTDVYIDGVYQQKNAYSIAGSQITFTSAPDAGAYIEVKTMGTIAPAAVNAVTTTLVSDSFTATADQTSFTLTNGTPSAKELTMVFVQGVYQAKTNYNLLTSPTRIVLTEGAEVGETVEVISVSGANLTTSPVTSVDGNTGAVTSAVTSVNGQTGAVTVASTMGVNVINSSTTATANNLYVFTANLTLTLPASPSAGDSIKISNRSGVATCVLARNGSNIMGSASDLTLDTASASFELIYSDATNGWVIIGQ